MIRPTKKCVKAVSALLIVAIIVFIIRLLRTENIAMQLTQPTWASDTLIDMVQGAWWLAFIVLAFVIIVDAWLARRPVALTIKRIVPRSLALGVHAQVTLHISNASADIKQCLITDLLPWQLTATSLPLVFSIGAHSKKTLQYAIFPCQRGSANWEEINMRIESPSGFWYQSKSIIEPAEVKIYPNFAPIARSATMSLEHQMAQIGVHLQQRRGEGSDFRQLRDFRVGDSLRQIDWNATARRHQPISREYQEERDQEIIFLLDSGRRLRSKENDISLFDHALNALLLTSYIALRQGDSVGFMSFGGSSRWLAPLKNPANISTLINQLYDLHSSTQASDYLDVAKAFLAHRRKRSLVIFVTNVREEDAYELEEAIRLLSSKHLVMVASLRDIFFDNNITKPVSNFSDALAYCGTIDYIKRRSAALKKFSNLGAIVADALPSNLHMQLVQAYLRLKRSGRF